MGHLPAQLKGTSLPLGSSGPTSWKRCLGAEAGRLCQDGVGRGGAFQVSAQPGQSCRGGIRWEDWKPGRETTMELGLVMPPPQSQATRAFHRLRRAGARLL